MCPKTTQKLLKGSRYLVEGENKSRDISGWWWYDMAYSTVNKNSSEYIWYACRSIVLPPARRKEQKWGSSQQISTIFVADGLYSYPSRTIDGRQNSSNSSWEKVSFKIYLCSFSSVRDRKPMIGKENKPDSIIVLTVEQTGCVRERERRRTKVRCILHLSGDSQEREPKIMEAKWLHLAHGVGANWFHSSSVQYQPYKRDMELQFWRRTAIVKPGRSSLGKV